MTRALNAFETNAICLYRLITVNGFAAGKNEFNRVTVGFKSPTNARGEVHVGLMQDLGGICQERNASECMLTPR